MNPAMATGITGPGRCNPCGTGPRSFADLLPFCRDKFAHHAAHVVAAFVPAVTDDGHGPGFLDAAVVAAFLAEPLPGSATRFTPPPPIRVLPANGRCPLPAA